MFKIVTILCLLWNERFILFITAGSAYQCCLLHQRVS
jgi:hypothetical protein